MVQAMAALTLTIKQAAAATGLSPRSLRYLIQQGRLGHVRLGRRVLLRVADLEGLIRAGYVKPVAMVAPLEPIRPRVGHEGRTHPARDGEAGR